MRTIAAKAFGENWASREFPSDWQRKRLTGSVLDAADKGVWNVRWDYDGKVSEHTYQSLRSWCALVRNASRKNNIDI